MDFPSWVWFTTPAATLLNTHTLSFSLDKHSVLELWEKKMFVDSLQNRWAFYPVSSGLFGSRNDFCCCSELCLSQRLLPLRCAGASLQTKCCCCCFFPLQFWMLGIKNEQLFTWTPRTYSIDALLNAKVSSCAHFSLRGLPNEWMQCNDVMYICCHEKMSVSDCAQSTTHRFNDDFGRVHKCLNLCCVTSC